MAIANGACYMIAGFETRDTVEAYSTAGTFSVVTSPVRTGSYALRCNPGSSAAGGVRMGWYDTTTFGGRQEVFSVGGETYHTVYFRLAALPSGTVTIAGLNASSGVNYACRVTCTSGGVINIVGTSTSSNIATISAGTWYRLDVRGGNGITCGARIDGGTEQTVTGSAITPDCFALGRVLTSEAVAMDIAYDDYAMTVTGNWIANGGVRMLLPTGDGTVNWAGGTGTTYAEVDDWASGAHDSGTTTIAAAATEDNETNTVVLADSSTASIGTTIEVVQVLTVAMTASTGLTSTVQVQQAIDRGTTSGHDTELTSSYKAYGNTLERAPNDTAAWTTTLIDGLTLGWQSKTIAQIQRVTAIAAMVWSDAAAGAAATHPGWVSSRGGWW